MIELTAHDLRQVVAKAIASTIELHRSSRSEAERDYVRPQGPPDDEEVTDFLFHNPLLDEETLEQLSDPGLLGFFAKQARATPEWLNEFKNAVNSWAQNRSWLAADFPWRAFVERTQPTESSIWAPPQPEPAWLVNAPASLVRALDLLRQRRLLSELEWREFEELIGALLEAEGWKVRVTQATRDGGLDVVASRHDATLGEIRSLWQAKKYGPSSKVRLREVRELSAIREEERATKAIIVTTSRLTRDAIEWIKRDIYRLDYKEHDGLIRWIEGVVLGNE